MSFRFTYNYVVLWIFTFIKACEKPWIITAYDVRNFSLNPKNLINGKTKISDDGDIL